MNPQITNFRCRKHLAYSRGNYNSFLNVTEILVPHILNHLNLNLVCTAILQQSPHHPTTIKLSNHSTSTLNGRPKG